MPLLRNSLRSSCRSEARSTRARAARPRSAPACARRSSRTCRRATRTTRPPSSLGSTRSISTGCLPMRRAERPARAPRGAPARAAPRSSPAPRPCPGARARSRARQRRELAHQVEPALAPHHLEAVDQRSSPSWPRRAFSISVRLPAASRPAGWRAPPRSRGSRSSRPTSSSSSSTKACSPPGRRRHEHRLGVDAGERRSLVAGRRPWRQARFRARRSRRSSRGSAARGPAG